MKKRMLALVLALIQCFSLLVLPASAVEIAAVTVTAPEGALYRGDTVTVNVALDSNPGMAFWQLKPSYDKNVFEVVSIVKDGDLAPTIGTSAAWAYAANSTYTGAILKVTYKVKTEAAYGEYDLGVSLVEAYDEDLNDVAINITNPKVTVAIKPVTGISLDQTTLSLDQGATATLTATVEPADAGDKTVTWTSSKESVATVNANGVVTAVGAGSATITAKAGEFEATCAVTVTGANVPVTGITLDKSAFYNGSYVMEGNSAALTATVTPDYATDKTVTWTSSDESVATVDANGVVNALKAGSVTITAASGDVSATCTITVIDNPFTMTADDETVALQYTGSGTSLPTGLRYYRVEIPAGTKTIKLSGTMATDWMYTPSSLKDFLADGVITLDLSTYGRSGDHWEINMVSKKSNGYWGAQHIISIYMTPCEGDHTFAAATCTAPATCTVCYATQGEALGHDWKETTAKVEPDCVNAGAEAIETCQREGCGATQGGKAIAALGHQWKSTGTNPAPTCTETGTESFICMRTVDCDGTKTETVAALGHSWNEGSVTTQPTCTEKGVKSFICLVDGCGGTKTEEVPANGHSYVDGYCSVCEKMEPTLIPFTKANHTADGAAIHTKFTGVVGLEVDGIKISDWTEWKQGGNYQTQDITIKVDPADKDKSVTFTLLLKEGQAGSGALINQTVTVQLNNGVGSYSATRMKIGTGGLAPQLNMTIKFELGECTGEHTWTDATCTEPKTCSVCYKTEGEALGHTWNEGTVTTDPTCDVVGVKTFACTVDGCDGSKTEDVPVLGHVWGEDSICTREGCGKSNVITEIAVSHPKIEKNESTGAMTMAMVAGSSEKIDLSFGLVDEGVASTQIVFWSSSDDTIATVADGLVTALKGGTVTITAKAVDASGIALLADDEEIMAQFTLTVTDPDAGYTVKMGDDVLNTVIGSNISVPVTIGHTGDVTKYNAFDLSFKYDPSILELTSTTIQGMNVTADTENGIIHVERYGAELTVGQPALTLTFKAIATGETNVEVTAAKADISESALKNDAPDAAIIDELTRVSVAGYTVTLPTDFTGESSVLPGEDYTFEAKDKNYDYDVTAKIGDTEITVTDNGDGTFTIDDKDITGNIVITTEKSGKVFKVTLGEDMTGAENAQYMAEGGYTATLTKDAGYNYNVTVTIGGVKYTSFTYDDATGKITIPGEAITGEIIFNSNKTAKTADKHSVQFTGEYGDIAEGTALEVVNGTDYVLTINKVVGYKYTVTATMGGETAEVIDNNDGTYTIKNVTGDLVITITKESDLVVEVVNYVNLNGKTMFLVTATATVDDNKVLSYDGTAMFYSNQYNAWSYLVITEGTLSVEDAKAKITLNEGTKVELNQTYNVNETVNETVDINDAQLVFDMYNNKYQNFDSATMQKFLKADVNGDKAINSQDAAAIVSEIVKAK